MSPSSSSTSTSTSASILTSTDLPLPLIARGKVRDVYDTTLASGSILFVATDRLSAFDVILQSGIPNKGKYLTRLSKFWFDYLTPEIIESHLITTDYEEFPSELKEKLGNHKDQVAGRSMLVKKAEVLPIEAIVRGYITGSGWKEYQKSGTVHGIEMPKGMKESQEIQGGPIFTPSTKAEQGQHDENIHPDQVASIIGSALSSAMSTAALKLYKKASEYALSRGIILADTKFEFGLVKDGSTHKAPNGEEYSGKLILIDEVLTPDSSRFWSKDHYQVGQSQESFDKQFVRDWMISKGLDKEAKQNSDLKVVLPDEVVKKTEEKYREALEKLIN